jgi:H+/Na+-translocating ferredoxin:NAD+ oxidoreductase subunit D
MTSPGLVVSASPHLRAKDTTPHIMWTVAASLAPVVAAGAWFFGVSALLVIGAAAAGAMITERFFGKSGSLWDGSAAITGVLLGLTLPAGLPLWMAVLGGAFGIGFGKILFGGLGQNVFNPALIGRAFLQAAFPVPMTTWASVGGAFWALRGDTFAIPFSHPTTIDALTAATPLGLLKFEGKGTSLTSLLVGNTAGSIGETSAVLILLCGAFLVWQGLMSWRIPVAIFATVAAFSGVLHAVTPSAPGALFMLSSGGLALGAVYMATDPVTAPITNAGRWIFGAGIGLLVVVIRVWGGLPEGVMYAILLMNAFTPFINKATQPRVFGTVRRVGA